MIVITVFKKNNKLELIIQKDFSSLNSVSFANNLGEMKPIETMNNITQPLYYMEVCSTRIFIKYLVCPKNKI